MQAFTTASSTVHFLCALIGVCTVFLCVFGSSPLLGCTLSRDTRSAFHRAVEQPAALPAYQAASKDTLIYRTILYRHNLISYSLRSVLPLSLRSLSHSVCLRSLAIYHAALRTLYQIRTANQANQKRCRPGQERRSADIKRTEIRTHVLASVLPWCGK